MNSAPKEINSSESLTLYSCITELILFLALIALIIPTAIGMQYSLDIGGSDENSYALVGQLLPRIVPLPNWAPLYSYWYSALYWLINDPIEVFILNAQVLYLSSVLFFYIAQRRLGVLRPVAFTSAWCYSTAPFAITLFPRVYQFAFVIFLATVTCSLLVKHPLLKRAICATGAVLLMFVRVELAPLALLLWAWVAGSIVVSIMRGHSLITQTVRPVSIALLNLFIISSLVLWIFGSPLFVPEYDRSFQAFSQGFVLNLTRFTNTAAQSTPYQDYAAIITQYFGDSQSVVAALYSAPQWFLQNMLWNARGVINLLFGFWSGIWLLPFALILISYAQRFSKIKPLSFEMLFIGLFFVSILSAALVSIVDYRHILLITMPGLLLVLCLLGARFVSYDSFAQRFLLLGAVIICGFLTHRAIASQVILLPMRQPNIKAVLAARDYLPASYEANALLICPSFLAPYIGLKFANPKTQHNSFPQTGSNAKPTLVIIASNCSDNEKAERGIPAFIAAASELGYTTVKNTPTLTAMQLRRF